MTQDEVKDHLRAARAAVAHARDVRAYHRRKTDKTNPQRIQDLANAREQVARAMIPLRSYLGKAAYFPPSQSREELTTRVKKASHALQSERRKLWKMMRPPPKTPELRAPNNIYSHVKEH